MKGQRKKVKDWLESGKSITSVEAFANFRPRVTRLSAVIFDLRKDMDIVTDMVESEDADGNKTRYARYYLRNE